VEDLEPCVQAVPPRPAILKLLEVRDVRREREEANLEDRLRFESSSAITARHVEVAREAEPRIRSGPGRRGNLAQMAEEVEVQQQ
jgi:hypothetical protein